MKEIHSISVAVQDFYLSVVFPFRDRNMFALYLLSTRFSYPERVHNNEHRKIYLSSTMVMNQGGYLTQLQKGS